MTAYGTEMWRWVQNCPAVHLVSRRISTSVPGFPNGILLHDVAVTRSRLRGRSEDVLFAEDPMLLRRLRRGLSFVESVGSLGNDAALVRRGLPKFFDIDAQAISCSLGELEGAPVPESTLSQKACRSLVNSIRDAVSAGLLIELSMLDKANGENAQVSFFPGTGQWVLCSKNVSLLAANASELELPQWSDRRYRFARHVAESWFAQLSALTDASCKLLEQTLAYGTLVGEMIGGSSAHLVDYGPERRLQWFAIVPNHGDEFCWPPSRSIAFMRNAGLPTVNLKPVVPAALASAEEVFKALQESCLATERAALQEVGEGYVMYLTSLSCDNTRSHVVHLGKMKSADYRLLRRMRDRAKVFAQRGGSMLIEDVMDEFRKEASCMGVSHDIAATRTETLGKLCRLLFWEDIPPDTVDEKFLHLLQRAESFEGTRAPRKSASALCVVAPPGAMTSTAWSRLLQSEMVQNSAADAQSTESYCMRTPECLQPGNLSTAWHDSTAARKRVFLNCNPKELENLFFHSPSTETPQKRRRTQVAFEERQQLATTRLAFSVQKRCEFLFWGWSDAWFAEHHRQEDVLTQPLRTRFETKILKRLGPQRRRILGKFQAHALRLWTKLPEAQTYWLPTLPSLTEPRAFSTVAGNFGAPQTSEGHTIQPDQSEATAPIARCTVTVIMPLGLPGMGKSSLLEQVFRLAQASALKAYRQGKLQKSSEGGAEHGFNQLHAVAMLSSDAFTGDELKAMGMDAAKSSSQDVVRCRRLAASQYQAAIEDFFEKAAAAGSDEQHLLLLDKNHPPSALRREAQVLQALSTRVGCGLCLKALALQPTSSEPAAPLPNELLQEEEKHFGPWAYPWSLEVLAECSSRLMLRSSHDTLSGNETSLFVLLGFLRLHHRLARLEDLAHSAIEIVAAPYVCTSELASWPCHEVSDPWHQLELRALFHQALQVMQKPFANEESVRPLLAAIARLLLASGLRTPDAASQARHTEACAEWLWAGLLRPTASTEPQPQAEVVPAVRYVALEVEPHHEVLESSLQKLADAMRAVTDDSESGEAFPAELFRWPQVLHVTTCFVGGGAMSDNQREILTKSKHLFWEGATFDCLVTHLIGARGALALAVVDESRLQADGLPIADGQRPHITLCTRPPWQPRHSNDVLKAAAPLLEDNPGVSASVKLMRNLAVGTAVLDVFVLKLENPIPLPSNAVKLC